MYSNSSFEIVMWPEQCRFDNANLSTANDNVHRLYFIRLSTALRSAKTANACAEKRQYARNKKTRFGKSTIDRFE